MINKSDFKKTPEELQEYLKFKRRGGSVPAKRGKGSYKRRDKHRGKEVY